MIGKFLGGISPEAESDVLTGVMAPGSYTRDDGSRCLVGWTGDLVQTGMIDWGNARIPVHTPRRIADTPQGVGYRYFVEHRYDALCSRFGLERINAAIRNRILSNQARRVLTPALEYAMVLR